MDNLDPCQKLIAAARAIPPDYRVPYAFEKRVMARLRGLTAQDPLLLWGQALWRAAALCAIVALFFGAGSFLIPTRSTPVPLPQAIEQALLADVNSSLEQIEATP